MPTGFQLALESCKQGLSSTADRAGHVSPGDVWSALLDLCAQVFIKPSELPAKLRELLDEAKSRDEKSRRGITQADYRLDTLLVNLQHAATL